MALSIGLLVNCTTRSTTMYHFFRKRYIGIKWEFINYQSHHIMNINILLRFLLSTTKTKILDNLGTRTLYLLLTQMLAYSVHEDDYL